MTVGKRLSRVSSLMINTVTHSSVAQLGDNRAAVLRGRTIALQRAVPNFEGDETRYAAYPVFFRPPLELRGAPEVSLFSRNSGADIRVGSIQAVNITASSLLRIGSGETVVAESRIKHIRQYNEQ